MLNTEDAGKIPPLKDSDSSRSILFLLLGASNLSRMYHSLTQCLFVNMPDQKHEVLSALGPGRAYVADGGLFVSYPAILDSPCFSAMKNKREEGLRPVALLTDIGNDFLYNVSASQLIEGLQEILNRLEEQQCRTVVTPIPPVLLEWLTPEKFSFLKKIFYPSSTAEFDEVMEGIAKVNRFLYQQESENVFLLKGLDSYLGWDHIHFDWRSGHKAWTRMAWALLVQANVIPESGVSIGSMCTAYVENAVRLVGTDFLKLRSRPKHFL